MSRGQLIKKVMFSSTELTSCRKQDGRLHGKPLQTMGPWMEKLLPP